MELSQRELDYLNMLFLRWHVKVSLWDTPRKIKHNIHHKALNVNFARYPKFDARSLSMPGIKGWTKWPSDTQFTSLPFHLCGVSARCQSSFIPLGPITSIGQQPACPSHLPVDSLSVFPHRRPASQSKGRESKGATYQVDYQEVLLWLIRTECAHNEGC